MIRMLSLFEDIGGMCVVLLLVWWIEEPATHPENIFHRSLIAQSFTIASTAFPLRCGFLIFSATPVTCSAFVFRLQSVAL
jgi:hypothetical protein